MELCSKALASKPGVLKTVYGKFVKQDKTGRIYVSSQPGEIGRITGPFGASRSMTMQCKQPGHACRLIKSHAQFEGDHMRLVFWCTHPAPANTHKGLWDSYAWPWKAP